MIKTIKDCQITFHVDQNQVRKDIINNIGRPIREKVQGKVHENRMECDLMVENKLERTS
jgi:hypothetical protein